VLQEVHVGARGLFALKGGFGFPHVENSTGGGYYDG